MRTVKFEGQLPILPTPHLPSSSSLCPPPPAPPLARSLRGFLDAWEHTPPPGPAAHPLCLGWRHTSSPPLHSSLCSRPGLSLQPAGADACRLPARPPGAAPPPGFTAPHRASQAPISASPQPGWGAQRSVLRYCPAFPTRLLAPLPLLLPGWRTGGVPVPAVQCLPLQPQPVSRYSPLLSPGGGPAP